MATQPTNASGQPILVLSDLTVDFEDYRTQINNYLSTGDAWAGTLTTQTSSTLVDLASTIGAFQTTRIYRATEDAFPETALSDSAIRSIAQMQGLRMSRYLPATITVTLTSTDTVSIPSLTQFTVGSYYYFSRLQFTLVANVPQVVTLSEGTIVNYAANGLGTNLQTWVSTEDSFVISDQDVQVAINNIIISKAYGGLWNYPNLPAYGDSTMSDGRLLVQFGNATFGSVPQVNDVVIFTYPITSGLSGNNQNILGKTLTAIGFSDVTGTVLTNPSGGANDKPVLAYKNLTAGSFGTYSSAVTKSQYNALVNTYPGIVDAITQSQREINPLDPKWMNIIRVSGLTTSPWTTAQQQEFVAYMQTVTMYAPYFIWQDAIPVPNDVSVNVFAFNTVVLGDIQAVTTTAIQNLFAAKPGVLLTNYYISDIIETIMAASPGKISYVNVLNPTGPMIVTSPSSPVLTITQVAGGGILSSSVYAYAISTTIASGETGVPTNWAFTTINGSLYGTSLNWVAVPNAVSYNIYGRISGGLGLIATVPAGTTTFTDNGTIVPTGGAPSTIASVPIRYNTLRNLSVNVYYAERQNQISSNTPTRNNI